MKKLVAIIILLLSMFTLVSCKMKITYLEVENIDNIELNEEFSLNIDSSSSYTITPLNDIFEVNESIIKGVKEGKGRLLISNETDEVEIEIDVVYTYPKDETNNVYVYLGIKNYGKVTNEEIDDFEYNFFLNGTTSSYKILKTPNYSIQNRLEEGKMYYLTIENNIITDLVKLDDVNTFSKERSSLLIEGRVQEIDKYKIKINNTEYLLLENTKKYEIVKKAGSATVKSANIVKSDNVIITLTENNYCESIYKEKETKKIENVVTPVPGERTLTNFLKTALSAVGKALYVYGGNWNFQDDGSSNYAKTIGVSPSWVEFFYENDANYNYKNTVKEESYYPFGAYNEYYYAGVDCSGFVGWVIYNVLNTENGNEGYVMSSNKMAKYLSETAHLGSFTRDYDKNNLSSFKTGDIISCQGHVWICLGVCSDNSLVIIHSTPSNSITSSPGGGCQIGAIGNSESCLAYTLASKYNKKYFPDWSARYDTSLKSYDTYLSKTNASNGKFSWYLNEKGVLDIDNLSQKSPEEILKILFNEE